MAIHRLFWGDMKDNSVLLVVDLRPCYEYFHIYSCGSSNIKLCSNEWLIWGGTSPEAVIGSVTRRQLVDCGLKDLCGLLPRIEGQGL